MEEASLKKNIPLHVSIRLQESTTAASAASLIPCEVHIARSSAGEPHGGQNYGDVFGSETAPMHMKLPYGNPPPALMFGFHQGFDAAQSDTAMTFTDMS